MTPPKFKTIAVKEEDYDLFITLQIEYMVSTKNKLSNADFFNLILECWMWND